jgi:beta-glucuronidase
MYKINFGSIEGLDLNGQWGLLPDPMGRCRQQKWWKSERKDGYFFPSYDNDAFWPTYVPSSYNISHPELEYYEGELIYLKKFDARLPENGEVVFIHFGAVADRCYLFLNGNYIGEHDGGHTAFTFDITDYLKETNRLLIIVDCKRTADSVPGLMHDWFHYGGIHRSVTLFYRPKKYIRDVFVTTYLEETDVLIDLGVILEDYTRQKINKVNYTITECGKDNIILKDSIDCRAGSWSSKTIAISKEKVKLWSLENPALYDIRVEWGKDVWLDTIGFREIKAQGKNILLNGEPVTLCGAAAWTEDPERGIFSMGKETAEVTVALLKDLNCNFARAGHCPQSREFIKECDKQGILVWMEVPAYWIDDMQKPTQSRKALKCMEEMIREHRNSPSIIFWSIGNECIRHNVSNFQSNLAYFIEAADYVKEEDPSRLVTYTSGLEGVAEMDYEKLEQLYPRQLVEKLDVISLNSYSGINDGAEGQEKEEFLDQYAKIQYLSTFNKPVILAEAGIDAVKGHEGFDFGEERQVEYHKKLQKLFKDCVSQGILQGMCLFVLNDYKTPIKLGRNQQGFNRKGLVTEKLEKKLVYYVVKNSQHEPINLPFTLIS